MEEIKQWIADSGDYSAGLALFAMHSHNCNMYNYLTRKNDPEKLCYELSKLADITPTPVKQQSDQAVDGAPVATKMVDNIEKLPDTVRPYAEAAMQSYHKARKAHTLLKEAKTDKQRAGLRSELLRHIADNKRNWSIVDDFCKNNILPDTSGELTATQLLSTASTLSRGLNSMEKTTDEHKLTILTAKIAECVETLKKAGRTFNDKTVARLRALKFID